MLAKSDRIRYNTGYIRTTNSVQKERQRDEGRSSLPGMILVWMCAIRTLKTTFFSAPTLTKNPNSNNFILGLNMRRTLLIEQLLCPQGQLMREKLHFTTRFPIVCTLMHQRYLDLDSLSTLKHFQPFNSIFSELWCGNLIKNLPDLTMSFPISLIATISMTLTGSKSTVTS